MTNSNDDGHEHRSGEQSVLQGYLVHRWSPAEDTFNEAVNGKEDFIFNSPFDFNLVSVYFVHFEDQRNIGNVEK